MLLTFDSPLRDPYDEEAYQGPNEWWPQTNSNTLHSSTFAPHSLHSPPDSPVYYQNW